MLFLALFYVSAAALYDQRPEEGVARENTLRLDLVCLKGVVFQRFVKDLFFEVLLHLAEVTRKRMNTERGCLEIVGLSVGKEFNHVLKVQQAIVHRSCRQQVNIFSFAKIEHLPIM